jgi:serine/threonine-protein kinase
MSNPSGESPTRASWSDPFGSEPDLPPDRRLGKYVLRGRLGRGGMGVVYAATDALLDRPAAVKVLAGRSLDQARERFLREARAAARLNHTNVVTVYEVGEEAGLSFLAMELLSGGSLQHLLDRRGPLPWREATRLAADACRGLVAAHAAGLLHRDIKPSNILLNAAGAAKLGDFGLALPERAEGGRLTREGMIVGTPEYMSPEQCRGDALDDLSDVYSLGATYYALLVGRPPYPGADPLQVSVAHCTSPVPDPRKANPDVPCPCADLLRRALAKEPADRPAGAAELLAALEGLLLTSGEPADRGSPTVSLRPTKHVRWTPTVLILGVGSFLAVGLVLVLVALHVPFGASSGGTGAPTTLFAGDISEAAGRRLPMTGPAEGMAFSPDGRFFAAGTGTGVSLWRLTDLDHPTTLWREMEVQSVAFSPDSHLLAAGDMKGKGVRIYDLVDRQEWDLPLDFGAKVRAVAFTGERSLVAGLSTWTKGAPWLLLLDVENSRKPHRLSGHAEEVWTVAVSPDRSFFASSAHDGRVCIWTANGELQHTIAVGEVKGVSPSLSIAPDGRTLAVGINARVDVYAWGEWAAPVRVIETAETAGIWSLTFAGPSRLLAVGGKAMLWDTVTRKMMADLGIAGHFAAVSPDGSRVALGSGDSKEHFVRILELP